MICFGVWERDERLLVDPPVSSGFRSGDFFVRAGGGVVTGVRGREEGVEGLACACTACRDGEGVV